MCSDILQKYEKYSLAPPPAPSLNRLCVKSHTLTAKHVGEIIGRRVIKTELGANLLENVPTVTTQMLLQ